MIVVYVHGNGNKVRADLLKRQWDQALFGRDAGDRSRMAYWAPLLHAEPLPDPAFDEIELAPGRARVARRSRRSPSAAPTAGLESYARAMAYTAEALADGEQLEQEADGTAEVLPLPRAARIAHLRAARQGHVQGRPRVLLPRLRGAHARRRAETIADIDEPFVVVAHSLGTIIAYDVLREEASRGAAGAAARHGRLAARRARDPGPRHDAARSPRRRRRLAQRVRRARRRRARPHAAAGVRAARPHHRRDGRQLQRQPPRDPRVPRPRPPSATRSSRARRRGEAARERRRPRRSPATRSSSTASTAALLDGAAARRCATTAASATSPTPPRTLRREPLRRRPDARATHTRLLRADGSADRASPAASSRSPSSAPASYDDGARGAGRRPARRGPEPVADARRLHAGDGNADVVYGRVAPRRGGGVWLQCWLFYFHSAKGIPGVAVGRRAARRRAAPGRLGARPARHPGRPRSALPHPSPTSRSWRRTTTRTGSPGTRSTARPDGGWRVYVGRDSHASFPKAGRWKGKKRGPFPFDVLDDVADGAGAAAAPAGPGRSASASRAGSAGPGSLGRDEVEAGRRRRQPARAVAPAAVARSRRVRRATRSPGPSTTCRRRS